MYNKETILEALVRIKEVCKENTCFDCPMYSDFLEDCFIKAYYPIDWEFTDIAKPWRAFKQD